MKPITIEVWHRSGKLPNVEAHWERAEGYEELDLASIQAMLSAYRPDIVRADVIAEGKANQNYRLQTEDGESFALRRYRRDPATVELEAMIGERLRNRVPVPEMVFRDDAQRLAVFSWLPGKTMESLLLLDERDQVGNAAFSLGASLARISSIHFPAAGFLSSQWDVREPWPSAVDGLLGYAHVCLASELAVSRLGSVECERLASLLHGSESRLKEVAGPPCLAHGDFKASNLLIQDGVVSGILDWEFVHVGTWLLSTAQILRHRQELPVDFAERFAEGFASEGSSLPPDWEALSTIVDAINLIDFAQREFIGKTALADVRTKLASL